MALVLTGALFVAGCGEGSGGPEIRTIREAAVNAAGRVLVVTVEGCSLDPLVVSVEQTGEAVVLTAEAESPQDGDCVSSAQVELDIPLLGRPVVDGATGEAVDTYRLPLIAAR